MANGRIEEKQINKDPMDTLTELISSAIANKLNNENDVVLIIKDQLPHPLRDIEIEEYVRRGILNCIIAISPNSSRTGIPSHITVTGLSDKIRKIIKS